MTDNWLLRMDDVAVGYRRRVVLPRVSLHVPRGSFAGLLGANGSGKSTLLKTIIGVTPPLSGKVEFASCAGREPVLGYVPQREALDSIFLLSSLEVALMGCSGRVPAGRFFGGEEKTLARQCLELAGAGDLSARRFSELSGGQKQRVLIARALAAKPDLLILDEPTAGIDAAASQAIMELLARIHREQKLTILMVNHDLAAMRRCVEEVIWLREGQVTQGRAGEMLTRDKLEEILNLQFS